MNIYYNVIFTLITGLLFVYGQNNNAEGECITVNKLMKKESSNTCCLEDGITCENGHITKM